MLKLNLYECRLRDWPPCWHQEINRCSAIGESRQMYIMRLPTLALYPRGTINENPKKPQNSRITSHKGLQNSVAILRWLNPRLKRLTNFTNIEQSVAVSFCTATGERVYAVKTCTSIQTRMSFTIINIYKTMIYYYIVAPCRSFSILFPFRVSLSGFFIVLPLMSMGTISPYVCINIDINCLHQLMLRVF